MQYVQVNIGRNVGSESMSDADWDKFIAYTASALSSTCLNHTEFEFHYGRGTWEGVAEESCHVSTLAQSVDGPKLRSKLRDLARQFGQDTVALVIGSELVEASHD